jgi:hypothetical protein
MRFAIPIPSLRGAAIILVLYALSFFAGNAIASRADDPDSVFSGIGLPKLARQDSGAHPGPGKPMPLAQCHAKFGMYV